MTLRTVQLWAHPTVGVVTLGLMLRAARLGVQSRRGGATAARARAAHRRLTPWVLGLAAVGWLGGAATVWLDRDDLEFASSGHFAVGTALVATLVVAALVSRRIGVAAWAARVHPWLGAAAILTAGVHVFLGLQIMPR